MSLVNKMLQDLEARQSDNRAGRPMFQDLQATSYHRRGQHAGKKLLLALALLAGGGYFVWQYWFQHDAASVTTTAQAVVPPMAEPVAASAPAAPPVQAPAALVTDEPAAIQAAPITTKPAPVVRKPAPAAASATHAPALANKNTEAVNAGKASITKTDRPYTEDELAAIDYREAQLARSQGNPAEAERRLQALLVKQPRHIQARELLATVQVENGRWPRAQETLEQGISLVPGHAGFRFQLARLLLDHGNEAQAIAVLERAQAENIKDPELPAFLAALYQRSSRHDEAIQRYRQALAIKPSQSKWWLGLGISLEAKNDSAAARDAYQRALDTNELSDVLARYAQERLKFLATH